MKRIWIGRILSIVLSLLFAFSAAMKLIAHPEAVKGMDHLGLPQSMLKPLGGVELLCVIVYLIPKTSVLGAILFAGYVGGIIITHWRLGEPFYFQILMGLLLWVGVYLRRPELHQVLWPPSGGAVPPAHPV
jgi:DoxX-like protein